MRRCTRYLMIFTARAEAARAAHINHYLITDDGLHAMPGLRAINRKTAR